MLLVAETPPLRQETTCRWGGILRADKKLHFRSRLGPRGDVHHAQHPGDRSSHILAPAPPGLVSVGQPEPGGGSLSLFDCPCHHKVYGWLIYSL